ncbi:hypothetical protein EV383_3335 [Pseudonocardia sediminis]|uniref:Uncharacterized protein n=1 Tax=Pseudonocardia sediminis TaxID=1397368 RepID=A0A4V2FQX5_PSEST|nr:hypothetical protein [Pseudonocardia sediminis]RZT86440.1 hypothetical protein EV383_3335 [Pseudonocardia sediminis]
MSGRHRQGGPSITARALAGTVPVLGAAGAATGLVLSSGAAVPPAADAGATTDEAVAPTAAETTPSVPSVRTEVPGRAEEAVSAVSAASDAAREQDALAQARDQRSVSALVEDVRADARQRDAVVQQQGRAELEAFQDQQVRRQQVLEQQQAQGEDPSSTFSEPSQPAEPGECDASGLPRLSPSADSDDIVGRDCRMTDDQGRERSLDSWIDGQLLSSTHDDD